MKPTVKIVDPHADYMEQHEAIKTAIINVAESGWYLVGKELDSFETAFAQWSGNDHAIGVANGTDALELSLRALGIGQGDAVLTVSHTAVATATAIVRCGATPVFVDIDPATYTLAPEHLRQVIEQWQQNETLPLKAIIPVHLYGHPADMPAIMAIAREFQLSIIEDCAQAHGAKLSGQTVGTFGDLAAYSFYPTKNLGAMGDAGAVTTSNKTLAQKVKHLREYGWEQRYVSSLHGGINSRMDEMQAAILRIKLDALKDKTQRRQAIASQYNEQLGQLPGITVPKASTEAEHVYHLYVVQVDHREDLRSKLAEQGIGTGLHYPMPVHLQSAFTAYLPAWLKLPVTEAIMPRILSLPMYPQLPVKQMQYVIDTLKSLVN